MQRKSMDLAASPRGKPAGACSELRPSCATSQRQLFWTGMQLGSGREWTDSRIPGTSVFWRTQGADRSCGRLSTVIKRNSTNPIQKFRHLLPSRPWNSVIKATSNDRDFWKEESEDKVADFRNVRQMVNRFGSKDRSRSRRRGVAKQESWAFWYRRAQALQVTGSQMCFSWNRVQDG